MSGARNVSGRLLAGLAVLILAASCTGSANPTSAPASTPGPTATTPPAPTSTPAATPTPPAATSPTGSMTTARDVHTATLLLDGRVLITGGEDRFRHPLASAELYDPKTGTFSPTGPGG